MDRDPQTGVPLLCQGRQTGKKGSGGGAGGDGDFPGQGAGGLLLQGGGEEKTQTPVKLRLPSLTREERDIILAGCLINYYAEG